MIKLNIGCVESENGIRSAEVKGRDLQSGGPRRILMNEREMSEAISEQITAIFDAVSLALESVTADVMSDILDVGIVLTGGGSLLPGLANAIHKRFQLPVMVSSNPTLCAARGCPLRAR